MKTLRSVSRREFSVGTAGWFTVLKPNTWFAAWRQPGVVQKAGGRWKVWPGQQDADGRGPSIMIASAPREGATRPALIVLAAGVITSALLWWIMHP